MSSSFRLELERWLAEKDIVANYVIDVGGSQEPVSKRVRSWQVKEYKIADLASPHKDSPQPDIVLDLNKKMTYEVMGYMGLPDVIFCLEVFDYVYNPVNAMEILYKLLKPGGRCFVSFPSHYPLHQPVEDDALRYMPGGITKLAQHVGLHIVSMTPRRMESAYFDMYIRAERLRAAKHHDHSFSGWLVEFTR